MRLSEVIQLFLKEKQLEGLQRKSIEDYSSFVKMFKDFTGDIDIFDINYELIEKYQFSLYNKDPKLSKATIATYLRHLKVFVRFMERKPKVQKNLDQQIFEKQKELLSEVIKIPRAPKRRVDILTPEQLKEIISAAYYHKNKTLGIRNALIIALMLDCGLRQNEVVTLTMARVNFKTRHINVLGKGNKERIVPLGNFTYNLILQYRSAACKHELFDEFSDTLLFTRSFDPINENAIKLMIHDLSQVTGIRFSSHTLRHNFATNWCMDEYNRSGTIDVFRLQVLLGHADISTTLIYVHMAEELIIAASNVSHLDFIGMSDLA